MLQIWMGEQNFAGEIPREQTNMLSPTTPEEAAQDEEAWPEPEWIPDFTETANTSDAAPLELMPMVEARDVKSLAVPATAAAMVMFWEVWPAMLAKQKRERRRRFQVRNLAG
jgi:hypothetical protein